MSLQMLAGPAVDGYTQPCSRPHAGPDQVLLPLSHHIPDVHLNACSEIQVPEHQLRTYLP